MKLIKVRHETISSRREKVVQKLDFYQMPGLQMYRDYGLNVSPEEKKKELEKEGKDPPGANEIMDARLCDPLLYYLITRQRTIGECQTFLYKEAQKPSNLLRKLGFYFSRLKTTDTIHQQEEAKISNFAERRVILSNFLTNKVFKENCYQKEIEELFLFKEYEEIKYL